MKEISEIIKAFDQAQKEGKRSALATVVLVEGSSYRRPGARMLAAVQAAHVATGASRTLPARWEGRVRASAVPVHA